MAETGAVFVCTCPGECYVHPEQKRCPTCESDHPRHYEGIHQDCRDPFHQPDPPMDAHPSP